MTGKRVTIVLDDDLDTIIRRIQIKEIRDTNRTVSFSRVINKLLRNSVKK
jgi:hypothetical protein